LKILVTGHTGYIGSVLAERLQQAGHEVIGFDTGFYADCLLGSSTKYVKSITKDIRDIEESDLIGIEAVIHLAALSNDPLGELTPNLTEEINFHSTIKLAELSKNAGVERFIFASTQSIYGISNLDEELDEDLSDKNPLTTYAKTKWSAEMAVRKMATDDFVVVCFRPSTIFGVSPYQRCDIVFNNFVGSALTSGKIMIKSDGTPWRPVLHIQDACQAFEAGIYAPKEIINGKAYNAGPLAGNYSVRQLAEAAMDAVPGSTLEFTGEHGADSRTYKVGFKKIHKELGDYFSPKWTLSMGAEEMVEHWKKINLTAEDFLGPKCNRLNKLRVLRTANLIGDDLRYVKPRINV
jgi:nucleoside-diphosphate-sugar epimerase